MNATITNGSAAAIPVTVWMGAEPTADSVMLAPNSAVAFANDGVGRVDCGVSPSNLTRLVHSLPAVDSTIIAYIQQALAWYNKTLSGVTRLVVTVQDQDATHGIYCVLGTLANQQVVGVSQTLTFTVTPNNRSIGPYIILRPVGFDQFTGPRGGSIPP